MGTHLRPLNTGFKRYLAAANSPAFAALDGSIEAPVKAAERSNLHP